MTQSKAPTHRSFSQLDSIRRCGEAFRLKRVEKVPSRPSVAAVAGKAIHSGTEEIDRMIHNGVQDPVALLRESQINAVAVIDAEVCEQAEWPIESWKFFGRQDLTWFKEVGIPNSLRAYAQWRLDGSQLNVAELSGGLGIELPFEVKLWEIEIQGFIDRLLIEPSAMTFLVLDLKSGKKPQSDEQLGLYRYALAEQYGVDVSWGAYLYGLKTGEAKLTPPIDLTHWDKRKLYLVYSQVEFLVNQGIYLPNPGDACFTCDVDHACSFARSAI